MGSWATEELKYAALPDKRLNQRLIKIVENLSKQPEASVPQASADWANTKATYNFWKSKRIELEDIINPHQQQTVQRASNERMILAIQDTSDFNFTHHQSKTWEKGFGRTCSQEYVRGLKVHSIMASTSQGVPLGILDQQIWTRKPQRTQKKQKQKTRSSILKKESKRWLTGLVKAELAIPSTTTVVTITDREGDIYDLFALERESNSELLIRAKHNRRVNHELKFVQKAIAQIPSNGQLKILVPRQDEKKSRTATLTIRYASFDFPPPTNRSKSFNHQSVTLNVISALEENPNPEVTPIKWLWLTTLEVNNFEQAICYIRWYTYRWLIERYHYVLTHWLSNRTTSVRDCRTHQKSLSHLCYCCLATTLAHLSSKTKSRASLRYDFRNS